MNKTKTIEKEKEKEEKEEAPNEVEEEETEKDTSTKRNRMLGMWQGIQEMGLRRDAKRKTPFVFSLKILKTLNKKFISIILLFII